MTSRAYSLGRYLAALAADASAAIVVAAWWPTLSVWDRIRCSLRHDHSTPSTPVYGPAWDVYDWPPEGYDRLLAALREEQAHD